MSTPTKTREGTWRVQVYVRGARESKTFSTRREALDWSTRRRIELLAEAESKGGDVYSLRDALRRYALQVSVRKRGMRAEQVRLRAFESHALPIAKPLSSISTSDLVAWRDTRLAINSAGSVIRDMTLLSNVFEIARREWQWIQHNPMRGVTRPRGPAHRTRVISGIEVRKMLRAMGYSKKVVSVSQAVAYAFLLALFSGMRAGEICAIHWTDVCDDYVRLHTSKTGVGRDVPLTSGARSVIERMKGWDAVSVFALDHRTLDALFRRYRARANLVGFTFHDSRHTAATKLAQHLHVLELCKMFGWKSTTQALTYYNPSATELAQRLNRQHG